MIALPDKYAIISFVILWESNRQPATLFFYLYYSSFEGKVNSHKTDVKPFIRKIFSWLYSSIDVD